MASIVAIVCTIARVAKTTKKVPYAVVEGENKSGAHGGSFCIFPKKDNEKAAKLVASLPVGKEITINNVGLANGSVYVYDDSALAK